jgi:putative DNA methylase
MIPKQCKRLIEVDFPIAEVSKQSAREKSIRHGHPSTLHLWWARRPLAACRSVLLGLLLPDPCDEHCPEDFKTTAREILPELTGGMAKNDEELRTKMLKFIADFSNWDHSSHPRYLAIARGLVRAAHPEETPLVVDPFAGGGSIPLEALRIGCDTFASDLNPVACLINKVLLEDIPRHGNKLAEELRHVGAEIKTEAEKELAEFYPPDPDGSRPIAYLWARTVTCEAPNCGAEIPLIRTTWLAKRFNKNSKLYTKLVSLDLRGNHTTKKVEFSITIHKTPTKRLPEIPSPTAQNGKAVCPCCKTVLSDKRVRAQLSEQGGGGDVLFTDRVRIGGAKLMAVISKVDGVLRYRLPIESDYIGIWQAQRQLSFLKEKFGKDIVPTEPLSHQRPSPNARGVSGATRIGINDFGKLYTARQKIALHVLGILAQKSTIPDELKDLIALTITKQAERCTNFVTWINTTEAPRGTFARQALTIAWDFIELIPVADSDEFLGLIEAMVSVIKYVSESVMQIGTVDQADATDSPLPDSSAPIWFTDPPYYDSIPYADLSDVFYCWLKRVLSEKRLNKFYNDCSDGLTPKTKEITWNQAHIINGIPKSPKFFEDMAALSFKEGRRILSVDGIGCVVFAHKTTEGWESLLSGLTRANWTISASWPIATERAGKLGGKDKAMLMTSVHLICRPREEGTGVGDWSNILRELPNRIGDWMERLDKEGIHGADLVFSCIGPALELFSRYERVETAEGRTVELAEYLEKVWEVVGRTALEQILGTAEARARNGAAGVLEEDARLTALFLWTLMSTAAADNDDNNNDVDDDDDDDDDDKSGKKKGGYSLQFDVARRFAQPLGIDLDKWKGRVIEIEKGVVRLLPVKERALQLFGEKGSSEIASKLERSADKAQTILFPNEEMETKAPSVKASKKGTRKSLEGVEEKTREATTLDRVHAAMLLQASGKSVALKALIEAEQKRSPDFVRLSNALSALYPKNSEEKRLLDAMLLAVPRR